MQFGAMEPKSVQARKLNELVALVQELKAEVEALKGGKQEEKPAKKAAKKAEEDTPSE